MAKKKKKAGMSVIGLVMLVIVLAGTALSFTGLFLDWVTVKGEVAGGIIGAESTNTLTDLQEVHENLQKLDEELKYFLATDILAWVTAAAIAVAAVMFILKALLRSKLFATLGGVAGIVALVAGVLTLVFTIMMCKEMSVDAGIIAKATYSAAIGCYLTMIGGVVGGVGALIGAAKR